MIVKMRAPSVILPVLDPFSEDQPFNLATRLDAQNFADVCEGLKEHWDSIISSFPSFVVKLRLFTSERKWNALVPHEILTIGGNNLLTEYHSITDAETATARKNRAVN